MKSVAPDSRRVKRERFVVIVLVVGLLVGGVIAPIQVCFAALSKTEEKSFEAELENLMIEIFGPETARRESEENCRWHEEQCREEEGIQPNEM